MKYKYGKLIPNIKQFAKIFGNKTIYLILILTNDKIISAAENSKQKQSNIDYLKNVDIARETR